MVQVAYQSSRSVIAVARSGNCQAIAYWLNTFLQPQNMFARASLTRAGCLQIIVAFYPRAAIDPKSTAFRSNVVKAICHRLWQLNSDVIERVQIIAQDRGQRELLWRQSVRVVSPARKAKLGQPTRSGLPPKPQVHRQPPAAASVRSVHRPNAPQLRQQIRQTAQQRAQFKALRSFFLTGSTAAAFIIGCWLGYADAPAEQTSASAHWPSSANQPSNVLQTAIGTIPIVQPSVADPHDQTATLIFGGDVALTSAYSEQVNHDYQWSFAQMDAYRQADVAMVNLNAPFTRSTTPTPGKKDLLKADPDLVQVLKNGGVDLVNLANSSTMDYAAPGLEETLQTLKQAGIQTIGAGKDATAARLPQVLNVKGQRIAYLGYDHVDAASAGGAGTNFSRQSQIAADIKAVRNQVDWVVVNYHWGDEVAKYPGDTEVDLARFTIDQGADLVVGYHAQVLQGAELYKGRPIVYSLSNFVFGHSMASDYDTAVLKVALNDKQMKVELLPVEVRKYQPRIVQDDRGTKILKQIETVSDIFQQPMPTSVVLDTRTNTMVAPSPAMPSPAASTAPSSAPTAPLSPPTPSPSGKATDSPWSNDSFIGKPVDRHSALPAADVPIDTAQSPPVNPATPDRAGSSFTDPEPLEPTALTTPVVTSTAPDDVAGSTQGNTAGGGPAAVTPLSRVMPLPTTDPLPASIDVTGAAPLTPAASLPLAPASEIPHPIQSLEPIKRRYAQANPPDAAQIAEAILLPSE